jgi:hypothetical protein
MFRGASARVTGTRVTYGSYAMPQGLSSNGVDRTAAVIQRLDRQLIVCQADGQFVSTVNPSDISQIVKQKDSFVWLDLQSSSDSTRTRCKTYSG